MKEYLQPLGLESRTLYTAIYVNWNYCYCPFQLSSSAAKAIYETLKNIDTLFGTDELPTMWDQQKLEYFQNIIYRQIEESECVSTYLGQYR